MEPKRVNRIKFAKLKQEWLGKLGSVYAFKGIKDYEEWAMGLATPSTPQSEGQILYTMDWTGPEEMFSGPKTDKELLLEKARVIREQLDNAIADEDYERAKVLQETLNVIEIKYNKL